MMQKILVRSVAALLVALACCFSPMVAAQQRCVEDWVSTFGGAPGLDGDVRAMAVFDDGSGPALYVGGSFYSAGGIVANRIARWDGERWSDVGGGLISSIQLDAGVHALAVYDDGSGPALYAAGDFVQAGDVLVGNIAKWDGKSWSALGAGLSRTGNRTIVHALEVFEEAGGAVLYAGGSFTHAGGAPADRLAKWNGEVWESAVAPFLFSPSLAPVRALQSYDAGGGPGLFVGGEFRVTTGGLTTTGLIRWDGAAWSTPAGPSSDRIYALTVWDDGAGAALYVGGEFVQIGGVSARGIARWDGASWSAVGTSLNTNVYALTGWDSPNGPRLVAGGGFRTVNDQPLNGVAVWDGSRWSDAHEGFGGNATARVYSLGVFATIDGEGEYLYAGGTFNGMGDTFSSKIARWDGESWNSLGMGLTSSVLAIERLQSSDLLAAGAFRAAGGQILNLIGQWDGLVWSTLGGGANEIIYALETVVRDENEVVYAGGSFTLIGGVEAHAIAAWDGASWTSLGSGFSRDAAAGPARVEAILAVDEPSLGGPCLFAAGFFQNAGDVRVNGIARWDGQAWHPLASGIDDAGVSRTVSALALYDDGTGPALYAGGTFISIEGVVMRGVARWDGNAWSPIPLEGPNAPVFPSVSALTVHDDGTGPALYVGGGLRFDPNGGDSVGVLRWDGKSWSRLGDGLSGPSNVATVYAFASTRGGLYVGGRFDRAGGIDSRNISKWDGNAWLPVPGVLRAGINSAHVRALRVFEDSPDIGPYLAVGGNFQATVHQDSFLTRRTLCLDPACPGDATGDGLVDMKDLNAVLSTYAQSGDALAGDVTGDGVVNFLDLNEVLANFGSDCR